MRRGNDDGALIGPCEDAEWVAVAFGGHLAEASQARRTGRAEEPMTTRRRLSRFLSSLAHGELAFESSCVRASSLYRPNEAYAVLSGSRRRSPHPLLLDQTRQSLSASSHPDVPH